MSRNVRIVLLCEDAQHESFAKRLLVSMGWRLRDFRVERSPSGRGSAEQYVRERFPDELQGVRSKGGERAYLVVMIDGDDKGVAGRRGSLAAACAERQIAPAGDADQVLVCVPTWNIETWLAYLDGEAVEESKRDYPRLARPRECAPHVQALADMCSQNTLRQPCPSSLEDACVQYRSAFEQNRRPSPITSD